MTNETKSLGVLRDPPEGLRWATGGGSPFGECNGHHLAVDNGKMGTLCGRIGPHTPPNPSPKTKVCGNCTRIAKARGYVE